MLRLLLRASLWLSLVPTTWLSLVALSWGLRADLWRSDRLIYAATMIFMAAFPLVIAYGLVQSKAGRSSKAPALCPVAIWTVVAMYVTFVFGWMPRALYGSWVN